MNILGPIRKDGGACAEPGEPRPTQQPMGQTPSWAAVRHCWSCWAAIPYAITLDAGLCDECQEARNKAMDDKIIPDDRPHGQP